MPTRAYAASVRALTAVKVAAFGAALRVSLRLLAPLLKTRFFFFAIDLLHLHDERHFALRQADNRLLRADAEQAFALGLDGFDLDFVDGHAHFV